MTESLEPTLYHSISLIQAFRLTPIVHQKSQRCPTHIHTRKECTKFARDTEEFYNPEITKVEVAVEWVPNELYVENMEYRHQYDEIIKHFSEGHLKGAGWVQKHLQFHNINIASYYTDKYALWLDFRTIDDNALHESGRRLENTSEGIRLQITKIAESAGQLSCYLYIFQDAQINISDVQFLNVVY